MDAKPQRIRVRGDENVPPSLPANKAVHQRNKSTPALNVMALGAKNGTRRAFGDVSNVKASRDDSTVGAKPCAQVSVPKPVLSQPAQRPMSMSSLKGILNNVTSKPVNPAGKAPPASKGPRRSNAVFRDHLEPVVERESSKEVITTEAVPRDARFVEEAVVSKEGEKAEAKKEKSVVADEMKAPERRAGDIIEGPQPLPTAESDATLSDTDEARAALLHHTIQSITSEPEEYWDDEEGDSHGALVSPTRAENTTGGTTAVIFPRETAVMKRELGRAKKIVDETRSEEDILEDFYDTSMVAEYNTEIFMHLRDKEIKMLPVHDYMANQAEIQWSMRSVLMDWLVQVHFRFALLPETLFLCVNYIDRFLSHKVVSLGKLQLVGATALFIAAKYEEITAPSVQEIVYMVDGGYSVDEILKAERFMLSILNFDLGWPGPMSFLRRISKADDYDLETRTLAKYFLELTIMDERFVCTPPSFAAAGAHCLARMILHKGVWTADHAHYSGYLYRQLVPVMATMLDCCEIPARHHQAIFEKYADRRFKRASQFVQAEMARGFNIPRALPLSHPGRLSGLASY